MRRCVEPGDTPDAAPERGIGRRGEVGRWAPCASCTEVLVGPGMRECPVCRALDGPYFGMRRDLERV